MIYEYIFIAVLIIVIILLKLWIVSLIRQNFELKVKIQEKNRLLEWQDKFIEELDNSDLE